MEVMLTEQESAALQKALRSYISDLGPEISQTDNARFRQGLKDERTTLESALEKLDSARRGREEADGGEGAPPSETIVVHLWWTELG